jgi:hypothetical protein
MELVGIIADQGPAALILGVASKFLEDERSVGPPDDVDAAIALRVFEARHHDRAAVRSVFKSGAHHHLCSKSGLFSGTRPPFAIQITLPRAAGEFCRRLPKLHFDSELFRHMFCTMLSTKALAMGAWWLPLAFLLIAVASAAVEYGGLVARIH